MENLLMTLALLRPIHQGNVLTAKGVMITHRVGIVSVSRLVSLKVLTRNPQGTISSPAKETKPWLKSRRALNL
jgi:hypothetical protein